MNKTEDVIDESLLRAACVPIPYHETEEENLLGHRGVLLNRREILGWKGPVPIEQYALNDDSRPEVITKVNDQPVEYHQDIQIRYLRPLNPTQPGDIIIR